MSQTPFSLENKNAIVTGAGRGGKGIGKGIALALAHAGANVLITARTHIADAEAVAEAVRTETGKQAWAVSCDVSDSASVEQLFARAKAEFSGGVVDILVNNAGITRDGLLLRMTDAAWDDVMNANLKGTFACTRAAAKVMIKQRSGRIINITSIMGQIGNPGQANYSASKAGIIGFTRTVARELGSRGITVNAVAPGFIQTQMTEEMPAEAQKSIMDKIPLARLGTPDDVGQVVAFLASPAASYITGHVLTVDGGMTV